MHTQSRAEEKFVRTSQAVSRNQYGFDIKRAGCDLHSSVRAYLSAPSHGADRQIFPGKSAHEVVGLGWTNNSADEKWPSMKGLAFCAAILFLIGDLPGQAQQASPADPALYGPYPTNYKEIVMKWLNDQLIDVGSARIEWGGDPKPVDLGKNGQHLYGYLVQFKVNARNRFGAYTGMQQHGALIRDGEVIKGLGLGY
jgi:hypothetical protein